MMYELGEPLNSITNLAFSTVGIFMAHSLYKSTRKRWQCIAAWGIAFLVWGVGANILAILFPGVEYVRLSMIVGLTGIFVYLYLFTDISFSQRVFTYFLVDTSMNIIVMFSRLTAQCAAQQTGFSMPIIFTVIYVPVITAFVILFRRYLKNIILRAIRIFQNQFTILTVFAAAGYITLVLSFDPWGVWMPVSTWNAVIIYAIMAIILVGYILCFRTLNAILESEASKSSAEKLAVQIEFSKAYYTELTDRIRQNSMYMHDLKHHVHALSGLCRSNNLDEIKKYIDEIALALPESQSCKYCSNEVINALLEYYAGLCEKDNIRFDCMAAISRCKSIQSIHLCVIFGNAMQNAVEAAMLIPDTDKRFLEVKATTSDGKLVIVIRNSYEVEPKIDENGNIITVKSEKGHGYGFESIRQTVSLYDGWCNFSAVNGVFQLKILLNDR